MTQQSLDKVFDTAESASDAYAIGYGALAQMIHDHLVNHTTESQLRNLYNATMNLMARRFAALTSDDDPEVQRLINITLEEDQG